MDLRPERPVDGFPADPGTEYYAPHLSRRVERQRLRSRGRLILTANLVSAVTLLFGARYFDWRMTTIAGTGTVGRVVLASELAGFVFYAFSVFLLWDVRPRRRPIARPQGTLDVLVPVCGEPLSIIERTIKAALAIDYPHRTYLLNDGRLAGADNWREVEELARRHGIRCFTRTDGPRKKAGNLNHALRRTSGDFVAVIDADHTVERRFASELLGYFSDDKVGFVTTPQNFRTSSRDLLGNREEYFYGHIQPAKDSANSAFSTGTGVIYRREALESIDGFSEWNIVEDLYSSYQMHAEGWDSVYHAEALTSGLCPHVGAEAVKQRLGWATDTLRMFFWDNPAIKRGLTWRQRLHYLQIGTFYLVMVLQIPLFVAPALVLIWKTPVLQVRSAGDYLVHALPFFLLQFTSIAIPSGFKGGLRAAQKAIYLAPTYLIAAIGAASTVRFRSPVTDKVESRRFSWLLAPQCVLLVLLVVGMFHALTAPTASNAIAALWAGWIASALAIPLLTFKARSDRFKTLRPVLRAGVAILALTALLMTSSLR